MYIAFNLYKMLSEYDETNYMKLLLVWINEIKCMLVHVY